MSALHLLIFSHRPDFYVDNWNNSDGINSMVLVFANTYIDAPQVDEELADQVWEIWLSGQIGDKATFFPGGS